MCTVTYLPLGNNEFILTSNRDETPMRKTIQPEKYSEDGVTLTYPKDMLAGGTWIGLSEKNRLVCLLNGGFEKHERNQYYKMSRGLVVKQILIADDAIHFINHFDFNEIEPFTLILVDWNAPDLETHELVWDGTKAHFTKLEQEPKIWSSSSLYTSEMKQLREEWFADWLQENKAFRQQDILEFHQNTEKGSPETSLKMKRFFVETVSTTSFKKEKDTMSIQYLDFVNDTVFNTVN